MVMLVLGIVSLVFFVSGPWFWCLDVGFLLTFFKYKFHIKTRKPRTTNRKHQGNNTKNEHQKYNVKMQRKEKPQHLKISPHKQYLDMLKQILYLEMTYRD
jgi:hypothetical protein